MLYQLYHLPVLYSAAAIQETESSGLLQIINEKPVPLIIATTLTLAYPFLYRLLTREEKKTNFLQKEDEQQFSPL